MFHFKSFPSFSSIISSSELGVMSPLPLCLLCSPVLLMLISMDLIPCSTLFLAWVKRGVESKRTPGFLFLVSASCFLHRGLDDDTETVLVSGFCPGLYPALPSDADSPGPPAELFLALCLRPPGTNQNFYC